MEVENETLLQATLHAADLRQRLGRPLALLERSARLIPARALEAVPKPVPRSTLAKRVLT